MILVQLTPSWSEVPSGRWEVGRCGGGRLAGPRHRTGIYKPPSHTRGYGNCSTSMHMWQRGNTGSLRDLRDSRCITDHVQNLNGTTVISYPGCRAHDHGPARKTLSCETQRHTSTSQNRGGRPGDGRRMYVSPWSTLECAYLCLHLAAFSPRFWALPGLGGMATLP